VEFVDERLTTVSAQRKLHQGGVRGRAGRAVIDQAAAVELLQHWLELRRA
jgi:putative Holliday junction resolvase